MTTLLLLAVAIVVIVLAVRMRQRRRRRRAKIVKLMAFIILAAAFFCIVNYSPLVSP
jgi:multisubunit Na+/H+ antiporter MnhB subunit